MADSEVRSANWQETGVDDFVLLDEVTEDALLDNMQKRYDHDKIYTYIGPVVISVNPYKKLDIYGQKEISQYKGRYNFELAPHVYSVADEAFRTLNQTNNDQCVIISGESGAGKTEASKVIMQYIAAVSGSTDSVDKIKSQLLESNPVLESFGNAKTNRNDNSSRFGKYMEIQFNYKGDPAGGKITNYLLEKSRIVFQAEGERNFHSFYELLGGLDDSKMSEYGLERDASSYHYLNQSGVTTVDSIDDSKDFEIMHKAMQVIGFTSEEIENIFKCVAGVLHLGNVTFKANGDMAEIDNDEPLNHFCKIFGCDETLARKAMKSKTISTKGESVTKELDIPGAEHARDATAKAMYDRMFTEIVSIINSNIISPGTSERVIGVLDIYGFEIFKKNSFEQLCINYCNEKLQQLFIELTLKSEQDEYVREGIEWIPVEYFNNSIICALIEDKPMGIIELLDESWLLGSSDDEYLGKLDTNFSSHEHYDSIATDNALRAQFGVESAFKLKHYAGDVIYYVHEFVDKNADNLWKDIVQLLGQSENSLLQKLFPVVEDSKRPVTAGTQFKISINQLIETLMACDPHYIRCIKPNETKSASNWNRDLVLHQVRYLGLFENVRVRRAGFAYRQTFSNFLERYKMLGKPDTWPFYEGSNVTDGIQIILDKIGVEPTAYQFGKTKIFLKEPKTLFFIEEKRQVHLHVLATDTQRMMKAWVQRVKHKRFMSAMVIQKYYRSKVKQDDYKILKAAIIVQKHFRGYVKRQQYTEQKAVFLLQRVYKNYVAKTWIESVKEAVGPLSPLNYHNPDSWPQDESVFMKKVSAKLQPGFVHWKANSYVKSLSDDFKKALHQKIITLSIFEGKKQWDVTRPFTADYLPDQITDPKAKPNFDKSLAQLECKVLFSDLVEDAVKLKKLVPTALILSDEKLIRLDVKKFKVNPKINIDIKSIKGCSVLPDPESSYIVLHCESGEDQIIITDKQSEFITVLYEALDKDLKVKFDEKIDVSMKGGKVVAKAVWETDPALAGKPTKFILKKTDLTIKMAPKEQPEAEAAEEAPPADE